MEFFFKAEGVCNQIMCYYYSLNGGDLDKELTFILQINVYDRVSISQVIT
jgi:hypothetical protein